MTCSSWLTSICKQSVSMYVTAWWSQPAATAQGACNLCHYLIHRHMSCLGPVLEDCSDLISNRSCVSIAMWLKWLRASVLTCPLHRCTTSASQWAPATWTEVKERLEVRRDVTLKYWHDWILYLPFNLSVFVYHVASGIFKTGSTAVGLNHPPQRYGQNCWCVSASTVLPLGLIILSV